MRIALFIFSFFILLSIDAVAQDRVFADDSLTLNYRNIGMHDSMTVEPYFNLKYFRRYQPIADNTIAFATSGNNGLASHSLLFEPRTWNSTSLLTGFQPLLFSKDSLRFYNSSRPFTQLSYFNGRNNEQQFQIFHTQNLGEGMNIAFNYRKITSEGFYINQLTSHTQFNATIGLKSRDQRFRTDLFFLINDIENQENGGLIILEDKPENDDPIVLDAYFRTNTQNQSRTQNWGALSEFDIVKSDSNIKSTISISHEFNWLKAFRIYSDDTTNAEQFYDNYFFDLGFSNDSSFSETISNELLLNLNKKLLQFGFRNEQLNWFQNFLIDEQASSNFIIVGSEFKLYKVKLSSRFEKGLSGFHKNELDWNTTLQLNEWRSIRTQFNFRTSRKQIDYLFANQRANHNYFSTQLKTANENRVRAKFFHQNLGVLLSINYSLLGNYTYLDSLQNPTQEEGQISVIQTKIGKEFSFLKNFHLNNYLYFQSISNKEVLPLPGITSFHSLYYSNEFFKEALTFQVGADVAYVGNYYGYAYSPSLANFHLRESDQMDLGNDVQIDLFINIRIRKTARIFIKMENILEPSFSETSSRIQDYSIPGRVLRFGLSWRMLN